MSDESDDISCPSSCFNNEKPSISPLPSTQLRSFDKSRTASGQGPVDTSTSSKSTKPKKRTVAKSSGRARGRPKRTQPTSRRKTVGKGLLFEDDVSPVQLTGSPKDNASSSDEDFVGRCVLRKRRVSQKKTTTKDSQDRNGRFSEAKTQQHDIQHELPISAGASFDAVDCNTSHQLVDELFGGESDSPKPECNSRRETATHTAERHILSPSGMSVCDNSDGALAADVHIRAHDISGLENIAHSGKGMEYNESVINIQAAGLKETGDSVDLDAELFGF